MTFLLVPTTPWRILSTAAPWRLGSQRQARRNALVSTAALARMREERLDVERYLAEHARRSEASVTVTDVRGTA
jgi:hypothetical protein